MLKRLITKIFVWEARFAIRRFRPRIVGITGSVGKSSTKEAISTVLESKLSVRKSQKSYNSEIGLSLAVLGLETAWKDWRGWIRNIISGFGKNMGKTFPSVLVLEMGVDRPHDLDILLAVAIPEIAVVTALGEIPVHVEFFSSPEELAREKEKIVRALPKNGYTLLNFDDHAVWSMRTQTKAHVIGFGFKESADIRASNYKISPDGISFKVDFEGSSVPVRLREVYGKHHVYAALAAILVGHIFGFHLIEMSEALSRYQPPPGRLRLLEGIKGSSILDDSYNASPLATAAALDVLDELPAKRKIVMFGDMLEIGKYTVEAHKAVGRRVAKIADYFVAVGPRSKFAFNEALAEGMKKKNVKSVSTSREAIEIVKPLIEKGDLILVKGSQGMRMERVVEEITAHPEEAKTLLVRQDAYWKTKE